MRWVTAWAEGTLGWFAAGGNPMPRRRICTMSGTYASRLKCYHLSNWGWAGGEGKNGKNGSGKSGSKTGQPELSDFSGKTGDARNVSSGFQQFVSVLSSYCSIDSCAKRI